MDNLSQFTMDTDDQNAIDALLYLSQQSDYDHSITPFTYNSASNSPSQSSYDSNISYDTDESENIHDIEAADFLDDGPVEYYASRMNDTLIGWTYTIHDKSICLTPPESWKIYEIPYSINVSWYKRPLYYSNVHSGYFLSNSNKFMNKVEELGALFDPDRV